jgi:UDP-N-acetylglucosamine 2-epimerase (non-hydrolysing)
MKIMTILGIRPDFIRMSEIIKRLDSSPSVNHVLVHSGQHYSYAMDEVFFHEMALRKPDYNCSVGSGTHGEQAGKVIYEAEKLILQEKPDLCLFLGDANPTLSAIAAAKANVKVAHIEAGMRSFDWRMPEEKNRIIVDHISDYLYVYTHRYKEHLLLEGIPENKIFVVGNPIVDIVNLYRDRAATQSSILQQLKLTRGAYILVTLHRQENVDDSTVLAGLIQGLEKTSEALGLPIYFPMSYRTEKRLLESNITIPSTIVKTPPIGFFDFLNAEQNAALIISDSGTVQEEACILQIPCVVTRMSTERPETIEVGGCILTGMEPDHIVKAAQQLIHTDRTWQHTLGDGRTSERIIDHIVRLESEIIDKEFNPPYIDARKRYAFSSNLSLINVAGGGWERPKPVEQFQTSPEESS